MAEARYPPAQHTCSVPVPTGARLYLLPDPPSWVALLFPGSLPPQGFRALLGGFTMPVWPNPSQLHPPLQQQTWQTPEHPRKESTRDGLSLHQGTSWEVCPPQLARLQQMQRSFSYLSTPLARLPVPAAPLTKPYPSPSYIHHLAVFITQLYPSQLPAKTPSAASAVLSPRCSCSAGCQCYPARSACTFPISVASSAALTPQPTGAAGILSGSPGMPLRPAKPPASPLPFGFMLPARWEGEPAAKGAGVGLRSLSKCSGGDGPWHPGHAGRAIGSIPAGELLSHTKRCDPV